MLSDLKQREKQLYFYVSARVSATCRRFARKSMQLSRSLRDRLTIIILHSDAKNTIRFSIPRYTIILPAVLAMGMLTASVWGIAKVSGETDELHAVTTQLAEKSEMVGSLREAASEMARASRPFGVILSDIRKRITPTVQTTIEDIFQNGFLLGGIMPNGEKSSPELENILSATKLFEESRSVLMESSDTLTNLKSVFSDVPSAWPLKDGIGRITSFFGMTSNPFTGLPYFHKGLDISNGRSGDPVIATANGKVIVAGFDPSYGNTVILQHKYGYFTRYAHMQTLRVRKGQEVKRESIIGFAGNTGLSTGPHVHYEVLLGGELTNPLNYIDSNKNSSHSRF